MAQPQQNQFDSSRQKQSLSLDFSSSGSRRIHVLPFGNGTVVPSTGAIDLLTSPDLEKFKLATPEVEKLIAFPHALDIPSISSTDILQSTTKDVSKPNKKVSKKKKAKKQTSAHSSTTAAHAISASSATTAVKNGNLRKDRGTETKQMESLTNSRYPNGSIRGSDGGSASWSQQDSENALPDADGPMSPSDKLKLERKRQRNRLAANKCRSKKLEKITHLENKRTVLEKENSELERILAQLQGNVLSLKCRVQKHEKAGCSIAIQK